MLLRGPFYDYASEIMVVGSIEIQRLHHGLVNAAQDMYQADLIECASKIAFRAQKD